MSATAARLRRFVFENSLSLFFLVIFLAALVGHAIAGHNLFNQEAVENGEQPISFLRSQASARR